MQYSKGDILRFMFMREMVLVLNDGIEGPEFVAQYHGQPLNLMSSHEKLPFWVHIHKGLAYRRNSVDWGVEHSIWYNILMGDLNVWITWAALCYKVTGKMAPWRTIDVVQ